MIGNGELTKYDARIQQLLMKEYLESRASVKRVTDAEIASAIRYLDPEYPDGERGRDRTDSTLMICFSLIVLLAGVLGCILLYLRTS